MSIYNIIYFSNGVFYALATTYDRDNISCCTSALCVCSLAFWIALINRFKFRKSIVRITSVSLIIWIYLLPIQYLFMNSKNLFIYKAQIGWMDYLFLYPFWLGLIFVLETVPYFIVIDGFYLISHLKLFTKKDFWKRWLEVSKIVVAAFFLVYVPIRSYLDTSQVRTNEIEINIENLTEEFEGLNFTLIGDVQVDRYTQIDKLQSMQHLITNTQSDLLFFAGDIVTQGKDFIQQALDALCQSQSKVANSCLPGRPRLLGGCKINLGWAYWMRVAIFR